MLKEIKILTIFPKFFDQFSEYGVVGKAIKSKKINFETFDIRTHGVGNNNSVDDSPYGGGAGMVMRPEPFVHSVDELKKSSKYSPYVLMTSPKGNKLNEKKVLDLIKKESIYILCGRYEGVDERVNELVVDEEISVGDYIVSGGEVPAMIISDTLIRKLPKVLGSSESVLDETFSVQNKLKNKSPVYTRPEEFMGINVPKILLSGDHSKIEEWKKNNRF
tara:strand:+ start:145 stop:801 length:657 start_codon:yes stop_codon:yes gene_type:complete